MIYQRKAVIEQLYNAVADISENRFISTRPSAISDKLEDFILIRLPQAIQQPASTYQTTIGQFVVFARDKRNTGENCARLEELQQQITSLFPISNSLFIASRPIILYGGSDGLGFHSLIIQFDIRIHLDFNIFDTTI